MAFLDKLSLSVKLKLEKGPEKNVDVAVALSSLIVDDGLVLERVMEDNVLGSWISVVRWTILRDCTTSPIVGRWLASGATQAAAIVHTRRQSFSGYFPTILGSTRSSKRSLSRRIGRAYIKQPAIESEHDKVIKPINQACL